MRVSEAKFLVDAEDATTKIRSLQTKIDSFEQENADLKSHLEEQQNLTGEYDEEKRALIEQIEMYEVELSKANASLKSKSNELDDALFSLDSERKKWLSEKNDVIGKKSRRSHDDINALIRENDELLAELDEQDLSTDTASNGHSAEKEQLQYPIRDSARIDELMEEKNELSLEQSRMRDENDGLMKRVSDLTDELADQRRQLIGQDSGMKAENDRLCQKNNDLTNEMSTLQQRLQDANKREENSVVAFFKSESEKSNLKSELNAANGKVNELTGKIQAMKKELICHENGRTQHNQSLAKIQGQVDELSLVNADLKQKNESLHRTQECIETKGRELQCLYSRAIAERDEAYRTRDDLIKSNANLLSNSNKISVERDRLLDEKDRIQTKLNKATAEYEAGRYN
jgi:chromosome segregation ATPase